MPPKYPAAILPQKLEDRQSYFASERVTLPIDEVMRRLRTEVTRWDVERDAIRSVVGHHATVELDVSPYASLTVRFESFPTPDDATNVCADVAVRATNRGLAVLVLLLNTLVGIPFAIVLRRRERARALTVAQSLIAQVLGALRCPE